MAKINRYSEGVVFWTMIGIVLVTMFVTNAYRAIKIAEINSKNCFDHKDNVHTSSSTTCAPATSQTSFVQTIPSTRTEQKKVKANSFYEQLGYF